MKRTAVALAAVALPASLSGCGGSAEAGSGSTVTVTIGYQSKTLNTVTAGTLVRSLGYFERQLNALHDGHTHKVDWQDYATGAPITAQMTAGKTDIGSMGDFPLLINAARGKQLGKPTRLVSVTGYNLSGGLDAQTRAGMQDLLVEVVHGTGATVVFVTHDVDEALYLGDRVALLGAGRLTAVREVPRPCDRAAHDGPARVVLRRDVLSSLGS